jgi:SET domain-containing protein
MNHKKQILEELLIHPIVKLAPSSIPNAGVGVFALTPMSKGEKIFYTKKNIFIEWMEIKGLEDNIIQHIRQTCNNNEYGFSIDRCLNELSPSYYVNHSDDPNLFHDMELDIYWAIKDIAIGQELTCKYLTNEIDWV